MPADNKSTVRRLYEEVWNNRHLEVADQIISPSHALHDNHNPESDIGPEAYKRNVTRFVAAFPDLRFTVEDIIAENDKVVACWNISGTHKGEYRGIPATNKKVSVEGITINHVAEGKIMDSFANWDALGLMQQLGVVPRLGQPKGATAR
ncbi:MAG TPA: ester cyclase [Candidatus Acidoferrum sp.]|nr:ester cyclase [Candidatus Acidoferrum sp.]